MADHERIHLFNGFTLDLARGCVIRAGEPVHLRPQSYEVLKYLAENKGRLISKDKLIEEVWKGRAVTDGSLGKCIEELREAFGPEAKRFIRNVRGRGYIFDPGVEDAGENKRTLATDQIEFVRITVEEQEQMPDATSASGLPERGTLAPRWRMRTLVVAALLAVAAATLIGTYRFTRRQPEASAAVFAPFRDLDIARLSSSGAITHAAISPDGKYVAHVVKGADGNSLWLKHVDAPSNVRIAGPAVTEYISATFSPDVRGVYYIALDHDKGESTLYRVPVLGGQSEVITNDVYPVGFSPDGRQFAFIRFRNSESHLVVADADGANQREVATRHKPDAFELEWNAPAWSPDGKTLACPGRLNDQRGHYATIIGLNLADGSQIPLTSARWDLVGQPVWLADGNGLLLTASDRPGAPMAVWHVSLPGGAVTRITHDLNDYHDLSLTTDASRLVAVQVHSV
jgi:DNA-binding winged helix-turn-helix (wHTH) protein